MNIICLKPDITFTCPGILTAVLPCLAYDDEDRRTVREMAVTVNSAQMKLVRSETEVIQYTVISSAPVTCLGLGAKQHQFKF